VPLRVLWLKGGAGMELTSRELATGIVVVAFVLLSSLLTKDRKGLLRSFLGAVMLPGSSERESWTPATAPPSRDAKSFSTTFLQSSYSPDPGASARRRTATHAL